MFFKNTIKALSMANGQRGLAPEIDILNPYNDSVLSTVSLANAEQVADTFEVAKEAQKEWAKSTPETRSEVMKNAATYLRENRDELIHVMSQETGGTLIKSNVELDLTLRGS